MVKVCSSVQMRGLNAFVGVAAAHIWEMGALPAEPNPPCAVQHPMCNDGYSSCTCDLGMGLLPICREGAVLLRCMQLISNQVQWRRKADI